MALQGRPQKKTESDRDAICSKGLVCYAHLPLRLIPAWRKTLPRCLGPCVLSIGMASGLKDAFHIVFCDRKQRSGPENLAESVSERRPAPTPTVQNLAFSTCFETEAQLKHCSSRRLPRKGSKNMKLSMNSPGQLETHAANTYKTT